MIVLDACVLIAYAESDDRFHRAATGLLLDLAEHSFAVSALTMAEVLAGYGGSGQRETAYEGFRRLGVEVVEISASAAMQLAELRERTKLRMPDCCVLLAALHRSAAGICTFDSRLAASAGQFGLVVHGTD